MKRTVTRRIWVAMILVLAATAVGCGRRRGAYCRDVREYDDRQYAGWSEPYAHGPRFERYDSYDDDDRRFSRRERDRRDRCDDD